MKMKKKKELTKRQKEAMARHKKAHGHSNKHIKMMTDLMLKKNKTFTQAHNMTMKKIGK